MQSKITIQPISVGDCLIEPSPTVRNLWVIFDQDMNLQPHVQRVCQTCYMHLRNIAVIRGAPTMKSAECLIHALASSKLDFCNSLLAQLSGKTLGKLHTVQNSTARILTCVSQYEHITPICHGLPVASRIKYKVLLLVYKALQNAALPTASRTSSSTARSMQDFGPQTKYSLWSQCFASRTMTTVPLALLNPHTGIHSPLQFERLPR